MAELPLDQAIPRFKTNEDRMNTFANGDDETSFTTSGGETVPSIQKFLKDKNDEIDGATTTIYEARDETVIARDAAEAAASAATSALFRSLVNVPSMDQISALSFPAEVGYILAAGCANSNDRGGGFLRKVGSEPSHAGKRQSLDGAWWELFESTVNPRMFGYSGAANERQCLRDMFTYPHASVVDGLNLPITAVADGTGMPGGYFTVAHLQSNKIYRNLNINHAASPEYSYVLTARGTEGASKACTSGANRGTFSISVANTTGLSVGMKVRVATDAKWGAEPSAAEQRGEIKQIAGISGLNVSFTEGFHDTYASGNNLRLIPLTMLENITLENCHFVGGGDGSAQFLAWFEYIDHLRVINCFSDNFPLWHYDVRGCIDVSFIAPVMRRADSDQSEGLNYGIVLSEACQRVTITDAKGHRFRHIITGGGNRGVTRFVTVQGGAMTEGLDAGIDTHPGCDSWSIANFQISIKGGGAATRDGLMLEGANHTVTGLIIDGFTGAGIVIQTMAAAVFDLHTITGCIITSNEANVYGIFIENYKQSGLCHGITLNGNTVTVFGTNSTALLAQSVIASGQIDAITISGGVYYGTRNGIYISRSSGWINYVTINGARVVSLDTTNYYGIRIADIARVTIVGNDVQGGWRGVGITGVSSVIGSAANNNVANYGAGGAWNVA